MRRGAFAVVGASLVVAGCLPSRDNPADPQNAPVAQLSVSTSAGASEGTRTTSFLLDASPSHDPRGAVWTISFDVDDTSDFERPAEPCPGAPAGAPPACLTTTLEVPPALVAAGGVGAGNRTVRARITTSDGRTAIASATAVVVNHAPVLPAEVDLFAPERTGASSRLSACGACQNVDPDGDAITGWSWTQLRGDPVTLTSANTASPTIASAPWSEQTLLFRVTASDGVATTTSLVRLNVTTIVWLRSDQPTLRLFRVYPDFRAQTISPADAGGEPDVAGGGVFAEGNRVWTGQAVHVGPAWVESRLRLLTTGTADDLTVAREWTLPDAATPASIAADGGLGCVAYRAHRSDAADPGNGPDASFFARVDPAGALVRGDGWAELDEDPAFVAEGPDASGDCWAVTAQLPGGDGHAGVYRLDDAAHATVVAAALLDDVTAAARAADGALWIAGTEPGCAGAALVRVASFSSTPGALTCVPAAQIDALAEHGSGVWAHDAESLRILAVTTSGEVADTGAPALVLPSPLLDGNDGISPAVPHGGPAMAFDAAEGHLWLVDGGLGRVVRLTDEAATLGDLQARTADVLDGFGGIPRFETVAASWRGKLLAGFHDPSNGSQLVSIPSHLRASEEVLISSPSLEVSVIPDSGEVWLALGTTGAFPLRRIDADGHVLGESASTDDARAVSALAGGGAIAGFATAAGGGRLERVDAQGAVLASQDLTQAVARVGASVEAGRVCAITEGETLVTGDLTLASLVTLPPGDWLFGHGITARATVDGCWFVLDFGNKVLWWDGVNAPLEYGITAPSDLDVDSVTGLGWLADRSGSGRLVTLTTNGATTLVTNTPYAFEEMQVGRLCPAPPAQCDAAGAPLRLWSSNGGASVVMRADASGTIDRRFVLPFDSFTLDDLSVAP